MGLAQAVDLIEKPWTVCGEVKPLSGFYRNRAAKDGRQWQCIPCHRAAIDRRRAKDPEAYRLSNQRAVDRHRRKTGNVRGLAISRARNEAIRRLIAAHERQFDTLYWLVKAERGLLSERDEDNR